MALANGIYKTDLPETDQSNVAFSDIGHASMQFYFAGFKKGQLKILAHDQSLGGGESKSLELVKVPLEMAFADAGLTFENVHMVEVVGSGSHVPAMIKVLTELFKKPRHTNECK
ncbi:hypothetical protein CMV_008869 [Castanea mollissima]|uniref:Uncharacterized protein n=1 Tax=Castanea mollissima TaxID=60419 RepID=A0A8J4RFJ5_9ROSI|nr:hypothetical protein CMV_008869 [Castanea mollissima]